MGISKFGEGFWVTIAFMLFSTLILCVAMLSAAPVAVQVATAIITVLGMIAAFWFPTRGKTTEATK